MKENCLNVDAIPMEYRQAIDAYIQQLQGDKKEQLIHVLHHAQHVCGYLPHNVQLYIARQLDVSAAHVNGVVTFYTYFNQDPVGKYVISVCMGTACFVKGADKILKRVLELTKTEKNKMSEDGLFTIKDVRCIGACGLAPVLTINEKVYGKVKLADLDQIIRRCRGEEHDH